jgi:CheY-like chemotaxis protein
VESALLNLAVNSRDAMPNGGEFRVETQHITAGSQPAFAKLNLKPGGYVAIVVADTGLGMQHQVLEHAREPFFTTKDAGKGSGLGLSMVHNFTRQCGGDLLIESTPGKGTTVTLLLAESLHKPEDNRFEQAASAIPEGHETILVVEDNKNVRRFTVRSLQNLGYHVLETDNSNTAMDYLNNERPNIHLLFSDIVIPGNKNGRELALWLLQNNPEVKVALTTGLRTDNFDELYLQEGIALLRKPYSLEKLAHFIREQLDSEPL